MLCLSPIANHHDQTSCCQDTASISSASGNMASRQLISFTVALYFTLLQAQLKSPGTDGTPQIPLQSPSRSIRVLITARAALQTEVVLLVMPRS